MRAWWLTFTDGSKACCEGQSEHDAKLIAEKVSGKKVAGGDFNNIAAKPLPYPAAPIIWQFEHPVHGKTPAFCYKPNACAGTSCCRSDPACTE